MAKSRMMSGTPILQGDNNIPGIKMHKEVKAVLPQIEAACREMGLDYHPIIVEFVSYDEMSEIASYGGFPVRYPHWRFGMEYEEMSLGYEHNQYRISEMIINCCVFETQILTNHGSKPIGETKVGDVVFSRNGPRRVVYVKKQPSSKVMKINLSEFGTETICTPDHKWLVIRGSTPNWVKTKDLVSGDLIMSGGRYDNFTGYAPAILWSNKKSISETFPSVRSRLKEIIPPKKMTIDLAELLGACVGDGSCGVRGAENAIVITVGKSNNEYRLHVENMFNKVFGIPAKVYEKPRAFTVHLNSKLAVDYFDFVGLKKTITFESKRIPSIVWASSNEYRAAFIRGMFDTDGYVGKSLSYSSRSEYLVKDLQIMLLEMGIRSKVKHVQNKHNDIWVLNIKQRFNYIEFQKRIGFSLGYKSERLSALINGTYSMAHGFDIPHIQDVVVCLIDAIPNTRKLPKWIKDFRRKARTRNYKSNSIWSFVNRMVAAGHNQFVDVLEILQTPLYEVISVEDAGVEETYDVSLDHNDHDFLANGLVSHNTCPAVIYCMDSNSLVDNVDVICHAIGHADFFKNNIFFEPTNENMINKLANHGERIRKYMARWGYEVVTEFIDHVLRIETLIDPSKAWKRKKIKSATIKDERNYHFPERLKYTHNYMDEWINPKGFISRQNDDIKKVEAEEFLDMFSGPEKDVFGYIKDHAPLKPWQQDIISMLYDEAMYFTPQRLTKTGNEGHACLLSGSLVQTDGGLIDIKRLVDNKLDVSVYDGKVMKKVSNWFKFENRNVYRIKTKRGYELAGSENHRVMVSGEWKQIDEMEVGDKIEIQPSGDIWSTQILTINWKPKPITMKEFCVRNNISNYDSFKRHCRGDVININKDMHEKSKRYKRFLVEFNDRKQIKVPTYVTANLGTFLGLLTGDGHISRCNREIGFTNGDETLTDLFISLTEELFGLKCKKRWDDSSKNGRWRVKVYSKNLEDFLVYLGLPTGTCARIKKIPDIILRSPKNVMSAFLRAYFDCDGCAHDKGVILSTSSIEMAKQVQVVLLNYGILCSIYSKEKDNYHLGIGGESVKSYYQHIGFNLQNKQEILCKFVYGHPWFKNQEWEDEVVSVEMVGKETVYDITVEETHRYAACGFMNHNSFVDYHLLCRKGLASLGQPSEDAGIWHYAEHKMRVLGGKYSQNPYKLGFELLLDIEDRWNKGKFGTEWENCTDIREKEKWNKNLGLGMQKVFDVRRHYNDYTLISEFFTPEFCEKKQFFEWKRFPNGEYKIIDRDFKSIKRKLLQKHLNGGLPDIRLMDPNHLGKGWFMMQHICDGRTLYDQYARETIVSLFKLWKNVIVLATKNKDDVEYVYICNGHSPDKDVHVMTREDYEKEFIK